MRNEGPAADQHRGGDHPEQPPTLTIAEAAQVCGVSTSTIRRHLRAGRFPSARQEPSSVPGQHGQWRIPTEDVLGAGLERHRPIPSGHAEDHQATGEPAGAWAARDRVEALEHALELRRPELAGEKPETATAAPSLPGAGSAPRPAPPPGILRMVPRPRRPKGELSQEERAAIIGWALGRERLPKRRWR